ncbi:MAG: SGNH/GDSL hydrolase family protein [Planctomycetota bacterium]|nr:SGNH/GDSL hydrolase family protein [Planctomycetota bacterium]
MKSIENILSRFRNGDRTRMLAFGSSNTEHFLPGMHWFDCLEVAVKQKYGRVHTCINTGIGGDTAGKLLKRFEEDAAMYRPHLAFVTVGGNDSFPHNNVSLETFRQDLYQIKDQFAALGTEVIFQTYYAPDGAPQELATFYAYMDTVREVARETDSGLVDHLARWIPFQQACPELYKPLMQDAFHLNRRGNAVIGVDLARHFNAELGTSEPAYWEEALRVQALMDELTHG